MNPEPTSVAARRFRLAFDFAVGSVLLVAGGLVIWQSLPPAPNLPGEPVSLTHADIEGAPTARVAVVEFSDCQCPICGDFERRIKPAVRAAYIETGRVQWAFRNLPLESLHPQAFKAASFAECARQQGRLLPVAAALFERQQSLGDSLFVQIGHEFGLDQERLIGCVTRDAPDRVRADLALARDLKITATPTILIGLLQPDHRMKVTAIIKGAPPLPSLRRALDDALQPSWYSGWRGLAFAACLTVLSVAAIVVISRRRRP